MKPPSLTASAAPTSRVARSPSLAASGTRVSQVFANEGYAQRLAMPWQMRALYYCTVIPELQYASNFYARMLQKIKIYPAMRDSMDKTTPITEGDPVRLLNRIQDPAGGYTQILYRYGLYQFVTGECYLFGRNIAAAEPERWSVVWREELRFDGDGRVTHMLSPQVPMDTYKFNDSNYEQLPAGSAEAYRMWTPDLRFSGWPTSPMQGVLEMAEELLALSQGVMATATSRLVRSKFFMLPAEMEPPPLDTGGDEDPESSVLLQDISAHVTNAVENPSDPASLAPFILFTDAELIAMAKTFDLHDPKADYLERDLRKECIERICRGLDLPPEVVNGMSSANHWAAWWISDDMWRSHGQPRAEQFCDDLSEMYLRPALREAGYEGWEDVVVGYDASGVVVNPDRSKDANDAHDRGELGGTGYRIMKNIPEEWKPTPEEKQLWAATKKVIIGPDGVPLPDTGTGTGLPAAEDIVQGDQPGPPAGQPGETSENTNLPASAFRAAAEMALYRCRELAGSRLRARRSSCPDCFASINGVDNGLVASALGQQGLAQVGSPQPTELVAGGADLLKKMLCEWGNDEASAAAVARLVETHAARTLLQEKPSISTLASLEMAS